MSAEDPANLTSEEQLIRDVFNRDQPIDEASPQAIFHSAANVGAKGGDLACAEEFLKCSFDRKILLKEFMKAVRQ